MGIDESYIRKVCFCEVGEMAEDKQRFEILIVTLPLKCFFLQSDKTWWFQIFVVTVARDWVGHM